MSNRVVDEATEMWRSIVQALADGSTITKKEARAYGVEAAETALMEDCGWLGGGGLKHMPRVAPEHRRAAAERAIVAYVHGITKDPVAYWSSAGNFSEWEDDLGGGAMSEEERKWRLKDALDACAEWVLALQVHPEAFWSGVRAGLDAAAMRSAEAAYRRLVEGDHAPLQVVRHFGPAE